MEKDLSVSGEGQPQGTDLPPFPGLTVIWKKLSKGQDSQTEDSHLRNSGLGLPATETLQFKAHSLSDSAAVHVDHFLSQLWHSWSQTWGN